MLDKEIAVMKKWLNQSRCENNVFTNKLMNIYEFIGYIVENSESFRRYCEFLIFPKDEYGENKISLAVPSHSERMVKYVMDKENMSREEVAKSIPHDCAPLHFLADKYGVAVCWYNSVLLPSDNDRDITDILDILNELSNEGIIDIVTESDNREYKNYLYRKSLGIYD